MQGLVGVALLLALTPSALHLPVTGPNGQPEVAPVPGHSNAQTSLSNLGLSSSATVGSGGTSAVADGSPAVSTNGIRMPWRCFGDPPRQTEDPLSPPCVNSWQGDNGGATSRGVTRTAIKVALYETYGGPPNGYDYTTQPLPAGSTTGSDTVKTLLHYFQYRYETYGRTVDLISYNHSVDTAADARELAQQGFFAAVDVHIPMSEQWAAPLANAGVMALGGCCWTEQVDAISDAFLEQHAPYVYDFGMDSDRMEALTARYLCNEIIGRPVTHAGDPTLIGRPRKLGLAYDTSYLAQGTPRSTALLQSDLKTDCGFDFGSEVISDYTNEAIAGHLQTSLARFAADGVTTVFVMATEGAQTSVGDSMTPRYSPEWIIHPNTYDTYYSLARGEQPDEFNGAIALDWRWKQPVAPQTYAYQAYTSVNPDGQYTRWMGPSFYYDLMQLFGAIQLAGPHLTPSAVASGMTRWQRSAISLTSPEAAYNPGEPAFFRDLVVERWNGTARAPGDVDPAQSHGNSLGCYEVIGPREDSGFPMRDQSNDPGTCGADWTYASDAADKP